MSASASSSKMTVATKSTITSTVSKKRAATDEISIQRTAKITKVHQLFVKPTTKTPSAFTWLPPLGPNKSCLHSINLNPPSLSKIAAFDLDGTLITAVKKGKDTTENWEWWRDGVVVAKLQELVKDGYSIVVISNQNIKGLDNWKGKIVKIAAKLPDVPFRLMAATDKDQFRKPLIGMWTELERIFGEDGVTIDKSQSFFVGDAAGRAAKANRRKDHASTDRGWASNVGIAFHTPEEYFLKQAAAPFEWQGFNPSTVPTLPLFTPTSSPLIPTTACKQSPKEIVLFVGYPSLGKTTLYTKYFAPAGYVHVNQDTLKTRDKCIKVCEESVKADKGVVVDNTNRDQQTRIHYVNLAKKLGVPIRCMQFTGSMELALHNNMYRAYNLPSSVLSREEPRAALPPAVFSKFKNEYEEPMKDEGFSEIKKINWVWEGMEEERTRWLMWHT